MLDAIAQVDSVSAISTKIVISVVVAASCKHEDELPTYTSIRNAVVHVSEADHQVNEKKNQENVETVEQMMAQVSTALTNFDEPCVVTATIRWTSRGRRPVRRAEADVRSIQPLSIAG